MDDSIVRLLQHGSVLGFQLSVRERMPYDFFGPVFNELAIVSTCQELREADAILTRGLLVFAARSLA